MKARGHVVVKDPLHLKPTTSIKHCFKQRKCGRLGTAGQQLHFPQSRKNNVVAPKGLISVGLK